MNAGAKTIEWLFREQLQVDTEWSVRTPNGFRWWADRHAQSVEIIGQEIGPDGQVGYLVSVRTELLRSIHLGDREVGAINALLMPFASMAGPVYDEKAKTISLASLVRVYDDICEWMNPLIGVAAALQIGEARIMGPALASALGAEEAVSGPPGRGIRPEPDELAEIIAKLIAPLGVVPSRWSAAEFQVAADRYVKRPPALTAIAGGAGLTVEFPYGSQSSLCQMDAGQPHPRYGNGLLVLHSFPFAAKSDLEGARLALSMNGIELGQKPFGYGFGSYAYQNDTLHFVSFFPNALYRPALLPNIYFSCALRAREMSVQLAGADWTTTSFSLSRSAVGQALRRCLTQ